MATIRLLSWNVNGLRAVYKKGAFDWFFQERPEILCLQETKAHPDQVPEALTRADGYQVFFHAGERKGYSGVGLFTQFAPSQVLTGFGIEPFDREGRILIAEYPSFTLFNIYFPNGKASPERLQYKMDFYDAFLAYADGLKDQGHHLVICGDVNTAHREIDLTRPKENETVSGFLPQERAWIDRFIDHGYVDTFRMFHPEPGHYTWWDVKTRARERNVGWRIDYFFVSANCADRVRSAFILPNVMGSDHCPLGIELEI